jgi:V8-like Glu-specific endopeptidase
MRFIHSAAKLAAAVTAVAILVFAAPAGAVIGGTSDTANKYANVGVLQLNVDGEWFDFCSGTLVAQDVVLTAAHCTDFLVEEGSDGFGPDDLRISFDPEGDAPYYTVDTSSSIRTGSLRGRVSATRSMRAWRPQLRTSRSSSSTRRL